jgi:hypothetical protein
MSGGSLFLADRNVLDKRNAEFGATYAHDVASFEHPEEGLEYRWCIVGDRKFILNAKTGEQEFYDLTSDPLENSNITPMYEIEVSVMRAWLDMCWDGKHVAVESDPKGAAKP